MHFPIVQEYKTDIEGTNPENQIRGEPRHVDPGAWTRVIVPLHAPFFVNSLKMYHANGQPLENGQWRIFKLMTRLTETCAQPVACMIELLDLTLEDVVMDYHVVGEFSLIDNAMLQLITAAIEDDRPVWWENLKDKPVVFPPKLHSHSLIRDIVAWQDVIECMDAVLVMKQTTGREAVQIRIDHYYDLLTNYIDVYSKMLSTYLKNHTDTVNEHGLTAAQVGLDKVDNFATANSNNVLQGRKDMHLTPAGLESIIETYGFDSSDFLKAKLIPLSRFGNTNFIPPSIDGSFEGLGSKAETCAICQESDGNIVLVGNRLDGRVNGLYCSVLKDYDNPSIAKQTFSAYKWTHPKFIQDGASPDMVVNGSNGEAMMVGDSVNQKFYIGITNGTMDPSKHVYCQINMQPFMQYIYSDWQSRKYSDLLYLTSIAVIGKWIYIFQASMRGSLDDYGPLSEETFSSYTYRHVFRVLISDVRKLNPLTPERVNLTFVDLDGKQWTNAPVWRWGTRVANAQRQNTRFLFNFVPYDDQWARVCYTQVSLAAPNPNGNGKYALKFLSYFYSGNVDSGNYSYANLEVCYEIDPETNIMTMISKIPQPTFVWANPASYAGVTNTWAVVTTGDDRTGVVMLDDLTVISSGNLKNGGYPWYCKLLRGEGFINRYDALTKVWHTTPIQRYWAPFEPVVPPTKNNVSVRPPFIVPAGEIFMSSDGSDSDKLSLYYKTITGKYISRSNIQNLLIPNIVSRALTNDIRRIKALPGMGGAMISVPSANLDSYGIEVGFSSLCVGVQRRHFDRTARGGDSWGDNGGLDDVLLIDTHVLRTDADGDMTVVPTREILYPASIVNALKQQVEVPSLVNSSPVVFVTICDPNGQMTGKFGWLPVVVMITYPEPNKFSRRHTTLTIAPTYSQSGSRATVTGFTVLDKSHNLYEGSANGQSAGRWDLAWVTGSDRQDQYSGLTYVDVRYNAAGQRCLYYLNGNALDIYLDPAVQSGAYSNIVGMAVKLRYDNRNTQRWTSATWMATQVNVPPYAVSPDNGISACYPYAESTGGAAIVQRGSANNPLIASVYPEIGWVIFFQAPTEAVFQGKSYTFPAGLIDLRDIDSSPGNKTFYVYATLVNDVPTYQVTTQKRLESLYQLWAATVTTNGTQIITVERYNVFALNGHRVSEVKRGNSIPAASGLVGEEGQIPWFYQSEILP